MSQVIVITGASSGFGNMSAKALAKVGHIVYAGMRDATAGNASVQEIESFVEKEKVDMRPVALNVISEESLKTGIDKILKEAGKIDVLIHNAGHMSFGPSEAFTPEQLISEYDVNCVGSSSTRGGVPPYLGSYFAAKAGMDALAVCYAGELTLWGIETSIVVPGAYSKGTSHFAHAATPDDTAIDAKYEDKAYKGYRQRILDGHIRVEPKDSDPDDVARAIVDIVEKPYGKRPFRVHVGTEADRSHLVNPLADFAREQTIKDMDLKHLLLVKGA
ncbi:hypothetical protein P7C71_g3187, partial [Lecanoromycetidae sp. Uapishka_2]